MLTVLTNLPIWRDGITSFQNSIGAIADQVMATGKITHTDQVCLLSVAKELERPLDPVEDAKVRQVFE